MDVNEDAVERQWEREQTLLGLARDTTDEEFARRGLATLAVDPTVRITVLPGNPSGQPVPPENPETVIPKQVTLPGGGGRFPDHEMVRGTSSGYVGYTIGNSDQWQSFEAVLWHGGVDVFLGTQGGQVYEVHPMLSRLVIYLRRCVGWAWAAFDFQRQMIERYGVAGPYRVILGIGGTAGAMLGNLGAGWAEPGSADGSNLPTAVEPRILLWEDLTQWPDEQGVEALALRFGARVDLAFGGSGQRHLDRVGPETGKFVPRW